MSEGHLGRQKKDGSKTDDESPPGRRRKMVPGGGGEGRGALSGGRADVGLRGGRAT